MQKTNEASEERVVLIVDDDPDFLELMRFYVEAMGMEVLSAHSRAEAERLLAKVKPDLAILDLMMERLDDGFALSYEVKKKDPAIPVVVVTAVAHETGLRFDASSPEEREWMKADALLDKPVRFEQVRQVIERLLKRT